MGGLEILSEFRVDEKAAETGMIAVMLLLETMTAVTPLPTAVTNPEGDTLTILGSADWNRVELLNVISAETVLVEFGIAYSPITLSCFEAPMFGRPTRLGVTVKVAREREKSTSTSAGNDTP